MRFVDEASLYVKAGDGGRGCVSFRREAHVPRGGPDGGDGGKGGDVLIVGRKNLVSLLDFKYKRIYRAPNGKGGGGRNKTGRNGEDLSVYVPVGTEVREQESDSLIADIVEDGQVFIAARGGQGGRGNARFVTSVHRVPTEYDEGREGEERSLRLVLKLLARIGIIGLPNAGKSSLLSRLTNATPEVGDYPFTTLTPSLGVMQGDDDNDLVLADIPGIIEGASQGKGLGLRFLRHIERTGILLWVVDASSEDVLRDYTTLRDELRTYKEDLPERERIVVLNKIDLVDAKALKKKEQALRARGEEIIPVSASTGSGIDRLRERISEKGGLKKRG
jgi:GTP-binding protein